MTGFASNLNRTVARQAKKIKFLEAKIEEQDEEIRRLTHMNGKLMADQQMYASELSRIEAVKNEYESGLEELKRLREKYQQAIFDARNIKKEYTKRFKTQVKRIKNQD